MDVSTRSSGPSPYGNYTVARLKESLWAGSYVGVMGIDKRSGALLRCAVADSGIGMPPKSQSAIFDVFGQVEGSSTRR
jgi:signal transduction histidine kinase